MFSFIWGMCCRPRSRVPHIRARRFPRQRGSAIRLEQLESRLAPAFYTVDARMLVSCLNNAGDSDSGTHAVVFFEANVANYSVLRQGLSAGTDAVVLASDGDGLRQMAAFLANRHNLTAIGIVAHGSAGEIALGRTTLDREGPKSYARELASLGAALSSGGELDLWSCDVGAGPSGRLLIEELANAVHAGVVAADHKVGSPTLGGSWQLNVRVNGARGAVIPFSASALDSFGEILGAWSPASSLSTGRSYHTATLLGNGKVLVTGGSNLEPSVEIYDPVSDTWSAAASMAELRGSHTATLLPSGEVPVTRTLPLANKVAV